MTVVQKQHQAFETLKAFNKAITTTRLYPTLSPQVANAVEHAYQTIKTYSRKCGELSFGNSTVGLLLNGLPVSKDLQAEAGKLVIYRHLELLELKNAVLRSNFDRKTFSNILTVFSSRKEKIDREGGGRSFVGGLGLEHFFPDEYKPQAGEPGPVEKPYAELRIDSPLIPKGLLGYLFGEHTRQESLTSLQNLFCDQERASEIIVAGIALVFKRIGRAEHKNSLVVSGTYTKFLDTVGKLLPENSMEGAAVATVATILEKTNERMLCVLFAQQYPDGFGRSLFDLLIDATPNERFDGVIALLRRQAEDTSQAIVVATTTDKLLATRKGKQFLGREKARALIHTSEKERQLRRLKTGITALLNGNTESLKSEEIVLSLPSTIERLVDDGKTDDAVLIIEKMVSEMLGGDDVLRRRIIQSLVLIGEKLLEDKNWHWLEKITGAFVSWVRESDDGDHLYDKAIFILQAVMTHAWKSGNYDRGDQILTVFHKIRTGQLHKSPPVLALVGRAQDRSYNRQQLETFLERHLTGGGDSQSGVRLSMLGRPAATFLVESLLRSDESTNRLKIIDLLTNMGTDILPILLERLVQPMPWYGKRNLIKMLAEIAGPDEVEAIIPFLMHDDIRVQREAYVCIYIISGEQRKQAMIKCLHRSSEAIRSQVVKALLPYSDGETAEHLAVLLQDQEHYSETIREPLVMEILKVLSRNDSVAGRDALRKFLAGRKRKANRRLNQNVWQMAESALKQVEKAIDAAVSTDSTADSDSAIGPDSVVRQKEALLGTAGPPDVLIADKKVEPEKEISDFSGLPGAGLVGELLTQGKMDLAKESLLELIGKEAREGRFNNAEKMREWLMEIDSMALSEIIRAAEIIEEEKVASIDQEYIGAWSELYDILSTEEFATLYHAMERKRYKNEELIVRQGSLQSCLYFIANGKVKIFYRDNGGETLVKIAVRGEILGAETVFDASVWTISAACLMRAEVMVLEVDQLLKWRDDYPALESKLCDFCMKSESLKKFFAMSGKDRRSSKRHKISGRVSTMLLDNNGRDTGITSKGDLFDVSAGGASIYLRISKKKNARLLLGRDIRAMVPREGTASKQFSIEGTIIAVRGHQAMENEYSVHIKFKKDLAATDLQAVIETGKRAYT